MESFIDELLNFSVSEVEDMATPSNSARKEAGLLKADSDFLNLDDPGEIEEEDLEWITNKDAFPVIDSFIGLLPSLPEREHEWEITDANQLSPISVLEPSSHCSTTTTATPSINNIGRNRIAYSSILDYCASLKFPVKTRSKNPRTGRRNLGVLWRGINEQKPQKKRSTSITAVIGRKCQHCESETTPQWRAGPLGPKTLCNACGVRYKSGRLVPEYRPANSPTFSAELHSNSHRKIVEMRKQLGDNDRKACG